MTTEHEAFPVFGSGFYADMRPFRFFVHVSEEGWALSVYNLKEHQFLNKDQHVRSAEDGQSKALDLAKRYHPKAELTWFVF